MKQYTRGRVYMRKSCDLASSNLHDYCSCMWTLQWCWITIACHDNMAFDNFNFTNICQHLTTVSSWAVVTVLTDLASHLVGYEKSLGGKRVDMASTSEWQRGVQLASSIWLTLHLHCFQPVSLELPLLLLQSCFPFCQLHCNDFISLLPP